MAFLHLLTPMVRVKNNERIMKRQLQKFFIASSVIVASFFAITASAFALDPSATQGILQGKITTDPTLETVAISIMQWILGATFTMAVIMIIIGGFRYVASAGNEEQAEAAKETITKAIIGLVVIILAFVILSTVQAILTGGCTGSVDSEGSTTICTPL